METRDTPILFFERGLFSFPKKKKKERVLGKWERLLFYNFIIERVWEFEIIKWEVAN